MSVCAFKVYSFIFFEDSLVGRWWIIDRWLRGLVVRTARNDVHDEHLCETYVIIYSDVFMFQHWFDLFIIINVFECVFFSVFKYTCFIFILYIYIYIYPEGSALPHGLPYYICLPEEGGGQMIPTLYVYQSTNTWRESNTSKAPIYKIKRGTNGW